MSFAAIGIALLASVLAIQPACSKVNPAAGSDKQPGQVWPWEEKSPASVYWVLEPPIPVPRSASAIVAYDGILYVLGGDGSDGTNFGYDPATQTWTQLATMSPQIEYPFDGCLGYNSQGEPIVALFPYWPNDSHDIMVYNVAHDTWSQRSVPPPIPSNGIWAHDIASDLEHNVCYLSGGATYTGCGDRTTLYVYNPAANTAQQLPSFITDRAYHASWFVPQWGEAGYLCIAGGCEAGNPDRLDSTQCYDVAQDSWHPENSDLGPLTHPTSNPADALKVVDDTPQIWIMGGAVGGWATRGTYYYDENQGTWLESSHLAYAVTRAEGATLSDELYVVGGDDDSAHFKDYNQHYLPEAPPLCQEATLLSDDFEGAFHWIPEGLWHPEPESGACGSLTAPFPSSSTAWYYGDEAYDCTYDTGFAAEGTLTLSSTLSITGAQQVTVTFWSYEETECGGDPYCSSYDKRLFQVSFDQGATWETLWRGSADAPWHPITTTSRFYPGDSLMARFWFYSFHEQRNDYLGWFIDDVTITACYPEPETPLAGFRVGEPACLGAAVPFSNTTIGKPPITYTWAFGDGTASTQTHPVHLYPAAGRYTVTLTAANPYGTDSASQPVEVHPPPTAGFSVSPPSVPPAKLDASSPTGGKPDSPPAGGVGGGLSLLCAGTPFSFTNTTSGVSPLNYLWAFGDGVASTETHLNHTYTAAGVYTVVLTATDACGRDSATQSLLVEPQPTAAFSYTPAVPQPWEPVWFTDLSGGEPTTWYWDFGDGYLSLLQHPLHTYWQEGVYTATLAATNLCGRDTAEQVVHVGPCFQYDFDCDCDVDVADLMMVAGRWQCQVGDDCYDPLYDSNGDGRVDILDIMVAAAWWGWTCGT